MNHVVRILLVLMGFAACAANHAHAFAPTNDQCAVNVHYATPERDTLVVEGRTYRLILGVHDPCILEFESNGDNVIGKSGLRPRVGIPAVTTDMDDLYDLPPLDGPGRVNIYSFGTQMYEIHLRGLKAEGVDADIELALYCYAARVFANLNVIPRKDIPVLGSGWEGAYRERDVVLIDHLEQEAYGDFLQKHRRHPHSAIYVVGRHAVCHMRKRPGSRYATLESLTVRRAPQGKRRNDCWMLCAHEDGAALFDTLGLERNPERVSIEAEGGRVDGYQPTKGFYQITTKTRGPRGFEEAWINPNQRYEVTFKASMANGGASHAPAHEIVCNVRNNYGVLEAAVLTDADGYPLPVQVQVCKNFGGEKEEGREEGDAPYGEAYFPIEVGPGRPFQGRLYHLFGNWGTHPLKQVSSIRFHHHYFHASLGPTETFCYVPFEFPREEGRNYILADVRGLSNVTWPGQPQHDHVSVVGALKYSSEGQWVNNLLQNTRISLTAPNLAAFAMDYLSEDGCVATTLEFCEMPQDDEARCFIKMTLDVKEDVKIDGPSARNLRFWNAGAYIVGTVWPHAAYSDASGQTRVVDVPAGDSWVLEGAPMTTGPAFAAAYPHKHGNMAFVVNRVEGRLGGKSAAAFGLSCRGGKAYTEFFLTSPHAVDELKKGDHLEAHLFVMPYGGAHSDYRTAERQRELYGPGLPKTTPIHGAVLKPFPIHVQADPRGFAEFTVEGGDNWLPICVDGFGSHRGFMLWEKRGEWFFHDQQIHGNDWYQTYRAKDGSVGVVVVVKVRPGQTHHYLLAAAPDAKAITQRNGFVTVAASPAAKKNHTFISPLAFQGAKNRPMLGTDLFRITTTRPEATSE